jgi:hypothetical protein
VGQWSMHVSRGDLHNTHFSSCLLPVSHAPLAQSALESQYTEVQWHSSKWV